MYKSLFKSLSLIQKDLLEDDIVHSWNIAKRIKLDGELELVWFADAGTGNIELPMGENGSSEPNSDILECLTLSIQCRLDINRERQIIERDNQ